MKTLCFKQHPTYFSWRTLCSIFFIVFSINMFGKEARTMNGWEGYFEERLKYLDPIEGIFDVQITSAVNRSIDVYDDKYAIARINGYLFRMFKLDGTYTPYYIERIGLTSYYYLTYQTKQGIYYRDRFILNPDGTFEMIHNLTDEEKSSIVGNTTAILYNNFVSRISGIKIFPDKNTITREIGKLIGGSGSGFSLMKPNGQARPFLA